MVEIRVLAVDDEPELLDLTKHFLETHGDISVEVAASGQDALDMLDSGAYDVVVSDYQMPAMDGLQLLRALKERGNGTPFILFTDRGREDVAVDALNLGASFYLQKGGSPEAQFTELANMVRRSAETLRSKQQLQESEQLYRTLFEKSPFSITVNALNGAFVDVNEKHLQLSGQTREQIIGKSTIELGYADPKDVEGLTEAMVRNGGVLDQHPLVVRLPSGRSLNMVIASRFIRYKGEPHVLSIMNDVSDLVEAKKDLQVKNEELDRERDRLQRITDQTPCAVYQLRVGPNGRMEFLFLSRGVEKLIHAPAERWCHDMDGVLERVLEDDREDLMRSVQAVMETRSLWEHEFRITDLDGTLRWVLGTSSPSFSKDDGSVIWTGTFTDITERRRSEEALRQANRQLSLMTSITRHDCLNKIVATLGYLDLAARGSSDTEVSRLIDKARTSVVAIRSEIELTRDLQDLGSQEPAWQDLDHIIGELTSVHEVRISHGCPGLELYANPMLEKVFHNLIDNSIRHGGHVRNVWLTGIEDHKGLTLVFRDDGVGIPARDKERIFVRGYGKNTGLGLFLAREVLSMTGIAIVENGTEGEGARFELRVPLGAFRYRT